MGSSVAIYALAVAVYTGPVPGQPLAMDTKSFILPPEFVSSHECQAVARQFNQVKGRMIKEEMTGIVGFEGPLVGAWCVVPVKREK